MSYTAKPVMMNSMFQRDFDSIAEAVDYLNDFTDSDMDAEEYQAIGKLMGPDIPEYNSNGTHTPEGSRRGRPEGSGKKHEEVTEVVAETVVDVPASETVADAVDAAVTLEPVKRGRGRPKGSKNKPKAGAIIDAMATAMTPIDPSMKRGRGRPKGSKNKPKTIVVTA